MLPQGRTTVTAEDVAAFGDLLLEAVWRDVAWMTDDGGRAASPDEVAEIVVTFRDGEDGPLLTAYLDPDTDDTGLPDDEAEEPVER